MAEVQTVIYYEATAEQLLPRCKSMGILEGDEERINKKLEDHLQAVEPVVQTYEKFGKVRKIDATRSVEEIYTDSKSALLPEVYFMLGPQGSGKSSVGKKLSDKTNMEHLNFTEFVSQRNLGGKSDEDKVFELIHHLLDSVSPRTLLENFPENQI